MQHIEVRLLGCFAMVFPNLKEAELRDASQTSVDAWDSLATVTLIQLIEEEFSTEIDIEDVDRLASFADFLDYVRTRSVAVG